MSPAGQENLFVAYFVQLMSRICTSRFSTWWTTLHVPRNSEESMWCSTACRMSSCKMEGAREGRRRARSLEAHGPAGQFKPLWTLLT